MASHNQNIPILVVTASNFQNPTTKFMWQCNTIELGLQDVSSVF